LGNQESVRSGEERTEQKRLGDYCGRTSPDLPGIDHPEREGQRVYHEEKKQREPEKIEGATKNNIKETEVD